MQGASISDSPLSIYSREWAKWIKIPSNGRLRMMKKIKTVPWENETCFHNQHRSALFNYQIVTQASCRVKFLRKIRNSIKQRVDGERPSNIWQMMNKSSRKRWSFTMICLEGEKFFHLEFLALILCTGKRSEKLENCLFNQKPLKLCVLGGIAEGVETSNHNLISTVYFSEIMFV